MNRKKALATLLLFGDSDDETQSASNRVRVQCWWGRRHQ